MKYIKTYENNIQFNNYVVLKDNLFDGDFKNKIGRIIRIKYNTWFDVKYENENDLSQTLRISSGEDAIKYSAKTKEELELKILSKKYNII